MYRTMGVIGHCNFQYSTRRVGEKCGLIRASQFSRHVFQGDMRQHKGTVGEFRVVIDEVRVAHPGQQTEPCGAESAFIFGGAAYPADYCSYFMRISSGASPAIERN